MEEEGRDKGRLRDKHNRKGGGGKERRQILQVAFKKAARHASSANVGISVKKMDSEICLVTLVADLINS